MHLKASLAKGRKLLPVLLIIAGVSAILIGIGADLLGIGSGGFGAKQICLVAVGSATLLMGIFVSAPFGQRYLREWQAAIASDTAPASLLLVATWFGMLAGWSEVLVLSVRRFVLGHVIDMGIDFFWMVPLANLLLFIILGLCLSLMHWHQPKAISFRFASFILAFTGFLSFLLLFSRLHQYAAVVLAAGLAVQTARMIANHQRGFHRLVRFTVGWPVILSHGTARSGLHHDTDDVSTTPQPSRRQFLIGAGATVAGMAMGVQGLQRLTEGLTVMSLPSSPAGAPNVLLIVLDTVRAHSLSLYGYTRRTTPNLERLAQTGVCFERALATSPWTLPSHASMFTGRFPHELSTSWLTPLDATYPTLAGILSANGYMTAGFVANLIYCTSEYGLGRGFAHYEDFTASPGQFVLSSSLGRAISYNDPLRNTLNYQEILNRKTAEELNAGFLRWLAHQDQRPFFAFLNYFDAHEPYLPSKPFDVQFGPNAPRGDFYHLSNQAERIDKWAMSPQQIQVELDAYEGAIAYLDHQLGLLFTALEQRGLRENTLIIVVSDHGEEFGEHQVFSHGHSLYLPSILVPLLVSFPSRIPKGWRVSKPVTLCDLPATVIDIVGLANAGAFPGQSLTRHWDAEFDGAQPEPGFLLSELEQSWGSPSWYPSAKGVMKSLVLDNWHYIKNCGDGREELYDFENDPWESVDLAESEEGHPLLRHFRLGLEAMLPPEQQVRGSSRGAQGNAVC